MNCLCAATTSSSRPDDLRPASVDDLPYAALTIASTSIEYPGKIQIVCDSRHFAAVGCRVDCPGGGEKQLGFGGRCTGGRTALRGRDADDRRLLDPASSARRRREGGWSGPLLRRRRARPTLDLRRGRARIWQGWSWIRRREQRPDTGWRAQVLPWKGPGTTGKYFEGPERDQGRAGAHGERLVRA